ncbi:DUF899 family protein [Pseudonocardia aurantiaca]|uniref:DUF899 family protein n=1 Tax=Pseudonocardia aurantiaca TaxID=75290 RepID=A0ABW4FXS6_9PSEU
MHLVCYLRDGDRVFETYWTTGRGVETVDLNYSLMDLTAYGRQEPWEDSPPRLAAAVGRGRSRPADPHQRTSHRPVVAHRGRPIRRPGHRRPRSRLVVVWVLLLVTPPGVVVTAARAAPS